MPLLLSSQRSWNNGDSRAPIFESSESRTVGAPVWVSPFLLPRKPAGWRGDQDGGPLLSRPCRADGLMSWTMSWGSPLTRSPQAITWQAFGPYSLGRVSGKSRAFGQGSLRQGLKVRKVIAWAEGPGNRSPTRRRACKGRSFKGVQFDRAGPVKSRPHGSSPIEKRERSNSPP